MNDIRHAAVRRAAMSFSTALLALASAPAQALSPVDPGDYTGLPGGSSAAVFYYQHITADKVYANGAKVQDDLDLKLDVGVLRALHYMNWDSAIVAVEALQLFGRQEVGLLGRSMSAAGDLKLGVHYWPLHDLTNNEHLGFTLKLVVPAGNKGDRGFALSDNRWALNPGVGYIRMLAPRISLDVAAQLEFYGKNRDTGVERDAAYYVDTSLSYRLDGGAQLSATYRHTWGAREHLDGATLSGRLNNQSVLLGWANFLSKNVQLELRYRQDAGTQQGPRLRGLESRLLYLF
ncbi:MAG: transporter [Rhodocyclaceae bacterium]|nr:transporter [Rhodocyclaceae bacterium]